MPAGPNLELTMVAVSLLEVQKDRNSTHFVVKRTVHAILLCAEDICLYQEPRQFDPIQAYGKFAYQVRGHGVLRRAGP